MRLLTALSAILLLVGCFSENPNKSLLIEAKVKADSISSSVALFQEDSIISVRERLNAAKAEVKWLGADAAIEFVKADAPIIGELSTASRYLKDAPQRLSSMRKEGDRCIAQINGLLDIIESGASLDANGDTINDTYIAENVAREIEAVDKLGNVYNATERLFRLGLEADAEHWSSIDSLITAKKGVWARSIAEE